MSSTSRLVSLLFGAALALVASGCSPKCGPSTCGGCCDAQGVCQAPTADHCGQNGASCTTCVGFQLCLAGACTLPGGSTAASTSAGSGSGTGASASGTTAGSSSSTTSATVTGTSSGATTATGGVTTGAGSTAATTASGTTAGTSNATASTGTTGSPGTTSASSTSTTGGTTGTTSSSSSSSSGGTTGGLQPICGTCAQNGDCLSGYCDPSLHYCNSTFACTPADCVPFTCGSDGNCTCSPATTSTTGTSGSSSSSGTTGGTTGSGNLPICAPCTQATDCASGYCTAFLGTGYCDTTQACSPDGGAGQDCGSYACNAQTGSCQCPSGTTGTSGSSGTTGTTLTDGGPDQCGINRVTITCPTGTCPAGYTCTAGTCELNGASSPLQVTLRWGTNDDLDLHLIEPSGCEIYYGNRTCTGTLDHTAGEACSAGTSVYEENDTFGATPPTGMYSVKADFWQSCANTDPVPFEVVVRKGSSTSVTCGTFHPADADNGSADAGRLVTTFTYP